jgi:hypothetical protein
MSFENDNILTEFIKQQQQPMQCKVDGKAGRAIYRCHSDFGKLDGKEIKNMVPILVDFGLGTRLDKPCTGTATVGEQRGVYPIQPDHYRAPEVILGCGWDFKADIWNFGVLVRPLSGHTALLVHFNLVTIIILCLILIISLNQLWNILGSKELFHGVHDTNGHYDAKPHLAEMTALLGPPPRALLASSNANSKYDRPQPVTNDTGKLCSNAQEFFGSSFFNAKGGQTTILPVNIWISDFR